MTKMTKDTLGIDISKAFFDAHRLASGQHARFPNDAAGMRRFARWLGSPAPELVVYEPTGPYHRPFELAFEGRLPLVKVNPLQARRFAQARGTRAKTDAVDARELALMGQALDLEPDPPSQEDARDLKELQALRRGMVRDRTALANRLKALHLALARRLTKARLAQLERQILRLDTEIAALTRACPKRARAVDILCSIPGIGATTAQALLAECPEIGTLGSRQAAALAGLAPMTRRSGRWQGKAFIQAGRSALRRALYMPALVAMRRNPDLAAKYDALRAAGKPHNLALCALMRKLIILANTLVRENRTWAPKAP